MALEPWYKVVQPRREVRQGRSFNPDEFAIALEPVVAGTAPEDYRDAEAFFARTCFTRALREHTAMVLRRLSGETVNAAPVTTLATQFGGGKTHALASLYHLVRSPEKAESVAEVGSLLQEIGLTEIPHARAGVFVGNAWDPGEGRETPWIDLARQLSGSDGVACLGPAARTTPPGTEALGRVFQAAGRPVLLLFDEVLNFVNRHRNMADAFHAFLQNLTVSMTGATHGAAVISLPRSQVEMTDFDLIWQDRITKVVRRVAKDLIANDEAEVSEVVRRRLFESDGAERVQRRVSKAYADWCFERRERLPPEWTLVDSTTEKKAREHLRSRFEACYPFHPAALARNLRDAEHAAKEEVGGAYRFLLYADGAEPDRIAVIDLGAGHSGSADSLCGRALAALRSRGLLNDSVGASYVERNWPPANSETGTWPLSMLRKCFLDGSLTRLVDPDAVLRSSIVEWVADGEFGLGSGGDGEGLLYAPERVWFQEPVPPEEVMFDPDICLLRRKVAERLKAAEGERQSDREMERHQGQGFEFAVGGPSEVVGSSTPVEPEAATSTVRLRLEGEIPSGAWNRVGLKLLPRLRAAANRDLSVHVRLEASTDGAAADSLARDLRRALDDLNLAANVRIESEPE